MGKVLKILIIKDWILTDIYMFILRLFAVISKRVSKWVNNLHFLQEIHSFITLIVIYSVRKYRNCFLSKHLREKSQYPFDTF